MKKNDYTELTREQSLHNTYLICLKWNSLEVSAFQRRWDNRPIFETGDQHEEAEEATRTTGFMGWQEVQQEDEKVFAV